MRSQTLKIISTFIASEKVALPSPVLVGIDGADGSGKSYFTNELVEALKLKGIKAVGISLDGFLNEKAVRYQQGRTSPRGFFDDSYNLRAIVSELLEPIKMGRDKIASKYFDSDADKKSTEYIDISEVDVVIVDGLFLHRDEFNAYWDCSVFLETDFFVSVPRGNARFGLNPNPEHESNRRYVFGNKIYQEACNPNLRASFVVNNNFLEDAFIVQASVTL